MRWLPWSALVAEFRDGGSYNDVYDKRDRYLGCCYLHPMGRRTTLSEALLKYDVDVSWWVTPHAYVQPELPPD